jgi:hypothetical protein
MWLLICAIVTMLLLNAGCERNQEAVKPVGPIALKVPVEPESESADAKLARFAKAYSALTLPNAGIGPDGELTTLDYQEHMDKLRGKKVGFFALLHDVYRANNKYKAVFGPFELGFDATIVLDVTEQDARRLIEARHKDQLADYVVVARLDALKVLYAPDFSVQGEKGDDPDSMDVDEFGLKVSRLITGELVAFEPEREKKNTSD